MGLFNERLQGNFMTFINELSSHTRYWQIIVANSDDGCMNNGGGVLNPSTPDFVRKERNQISYIKNFGPLTKIALARRHILCAP